MTLDTDDGPPHRAREASWLAASCGDGVLVIADQPPGPPAAPTRVILGPHTSCMARMKIELMRHPALACRLPSVRV
jgi:hypothetical protein